MPRIIAVAAAALVVYQWAVARPLWLDEEMIAINIRERALMALGGPLSLGQSAPLGWLALQHVLVVLFGSGERVLRFVPMLFGLATVATALWIGRRWMSALSASTLVLLIGVGQWLTYSYVELKPYSADVCFALLLPALAAWALETDRTLGWWLVAAVAQFFGNGAIFVTPACALLIVGSVWRRRGLRAAMLAAAPGVIWLALFAVNYVAVLRPAQTSAFLQTFWQLEFPSWQTGFVGVLRWFGARLAAFATKPGGTRVGALLWLAAAIGFAASSGRLRRLATAFALVPLSAFVLSTAHAVPFFERLVLWVVPAMFVGVALLWESRPKGLRYAGAAIALLIAADVTYVGLVDLRARPKDSHHRLDDRGAVQWLLAREGPRDVWVTTHLALPAIWWYGGDANRDVVEVRDAEDRLDCHHAALARALAGRQRVLVLLGFRFDDVPKNFDDRLLNTLADYGQMTAYRGFGEASRVAIVDLGLTSRRDHIPASVGCVGAQPARRW